MHIFKINTDIQLPVIIKYNICKTYLLSGMSPAQANSWVLPPVTPSFLKMLE